MRSRRARSGEPSGGPRTRVHTHRHGLARGRRRPPAFRRPPAASLGGGFPGAAFGGGCGPRTRARSEERRLRPWIGPCAPPRRRDPGVRTESGEHDDGGDGSPIRCECVHVEGISPRSPFRGRGARYRRRLGCVSSLTVSEWRPFLRLRARILRPARVFIRARNPWSLRRFRLLGFLYVGSINAHSPRCALPACVNGRKPRILGDKHGDVNVGRAARNGIRSCGLTAAAAPSSLVAPEVAPRSPARFFGATPAWN